VDVNSAAGLLIQEMPGNEPVEDEDAWNRVNMLADTVRDTELLQLNPHELLHRLFHEELVTVFAPQHWQFECRCSRERVATMLKGLGRLELDSIIEDEGLIKVDCEYCSAPYRFDTVDVEQLFSDALSSAPPPNTRH
jgi:molecular chaperone Hsp33